MLLFSQNLGRFMLAPYGCLVAKVLPEKHIWKDYVGLDACAANLMRPAMYGAYHHITVLGKENEPCDHMYDVTGGLCENNDKFAIDRMLPKIDIGDYVVIHDTGAHGFSMGYNYNGKLRSAELLLKEDGTVKQIRRAETPQDYFATLDYRLEGRKIKTKIKASAGLQPGFLFVENCVKFPLHKTCVLVYYKEESKNILLTKVSNWCII